MNPFNPFQSVTCAEAAREIRNVLGVVTCLGPNVGAMLRGLDKCQGGACPGHPMIAVIAGATAHAEKDVVLALLN